MQLLILYIIIGYMFGSVPTALILSKRKNIDIRKHGSGNIGGTNTFRVLGKKAGILVTAIDILKGFIPTLIILYFSGETNAVAAGIAASLGHSYSIFAGFKGGKSVATSAGVMIALNPLSILLGIAVFALALFLTKYVSLSSMLAAASVVIYILTMENSVLIKLTTIFLAGFVVFRHHSNIRRLIGGNENKAFQKKNK